MASDFKEKFNSFMAHRNGPDQLSRDSLILAIALLVVSALTRDAARSVFLALGVAAMVYAYFRMFSSKTVERGRENSAYLAKRNPLVAKLTKPFQGVAQRGQKAAAQAARQAQDKDHRYFACPKCGQTVRVPKGAGKIRVTCPKCGERFEKKA